MVPLWLFGVLHDDVWEYALSDLLGIWRGKLLTASRKALLDIPRAVGMGIYGRKCAGLGGAVCFRFLQSYADICLDRPDRDGLIPSQDMVFLLPDGDNDTGDL